MTDPALKKVIEGLRLLHPKATVCEVRILNTPRGTVSGYFDDLDKLAHAITPWDGRASIFATVNPVIPDLLARAPNRLIHFAKTTTKDEQILCRYWLPVDVDPVVPRGVPANDVETAVALKQRDIIISWVRAGGWPEPVTAMSGNGAHALWRVDMRNDDASRSLFERALKVLSAWFTIPAVTVDTSCPSGKDAPTPAGRSGGQVQRGVRRLSSAGAAQGDGLARARSSVSVAS